MIRSLICYLLFTATALADQVVQPVEYEIDGTTFESVLVYEGNLRVQRPGLVMVPNWLGVTETAIERAKEIAGERYVVLVADMYGKGKRPKNFDEAGAMSMAAMSDRAMVRARAARAVEALKESGEAFVRPGRIGAFGFCFGGTVALELARSGAEIAGVVSLHGNPKPVLPAEKGAVKASVLVLHGAEDFFVPAENLREFEAEMRAAGADWTLVEFSGAKHCFAEPEARNEPPGCIYNARAAGRAYRMLYAFFDERFSDTR